MGFSDFIKKIIRKKEAEKTKKETGETAFKELESWIKNKEDEFKNKEKETLSLLNDLSTNAIEEIQEKIEILEKVDIDSKKAEEETKSFVKENLSN